MTDTATTRKTIEELLPDLGSFFLVYGAFPPPTGKWYVADNGHIDPDGENPGWTRFRHYATICDEKDADEWIAGLTTAAHGRQGTPRLQKTTFHKEKISVD